MGSLRSIQNERRTDRLEAEIAAEFNEWAEHYLRLVTTEKGDEVLWDLWVYEAYICQKPGRGQRWFLDCDEVDKYFIPRETVYSLWRNGLVERVRFATEKGWSVLKITSAGYDLVEERFYWMTGREDGDVEREIPARR